MHLSKILVIMMLLYSYVFSIPEEFKENVISYGGEGEARIHVLAKK